MPNHQRCRRLLVLLLAVAVCSAAGRATAACDGGLWVEARCAGAAGNGAADDTAALRRAIHRALATGVPLLLRAGTYKVTRGLVIDYRTRATTGFRLISRGAIIDGRTISDGPTLRIECSGGSAAAPKGCFYFHQEGTLLVYANADAYAVVIGKEDFSDAHNSAKIDHLIVNNAGGGVHAGGLQLNYVLDSAIFAVGDTAGGAAGIALEQTQFSRLSGAGSASAAGGVGLLLETGYDIANTVSAIDLEVAPTCLAIRSSNAARNTFLSPYFACPTAVDAAAGDATVLINPLFAGNVTTKFAAAVGVVTLP
jgi:hypothetical protein